MYAPRPAALVAEAVTVPLIVAGREGLTLGLSAGVPAPEVAHRAGPGVAVLLRVHAGCIDGHGQLWNARIDDALQDETAG